MGSKQISLEMAKLYKTGMTLLEIGNKYGVTKQSVHKRLKALEIKCTRRQRKPVKINKASLNGLYDKDKLPLAELARAFNVSTTTINRALKLY